MSYDTHDSWALQRENRTDFLPDSLVWFQDKSQPSISNGISKRSEERLKKNPLSIGSGLLLQLIIKLEGNIEG